MKGANEKGLVDLAFQRQWVCFSASNLSTDPTPFSPLTPSLQSDWSRRWDPDRMEIGSLWKLWVGNPEGPITQPWEPKLLSVTRRSEWLVQGYGITAESSQKEKSTFWGHTLPSIHAFSIVVHKVWFVWNLQLATHIRLNIHDKENTGAIGVGWP